MYVSYCFGFSSIFCFKPHTSLFFSQTTCGFSAPFWLLRSCMWQETSHQALWYVRSWLLRPSALLYSSRPALEGLIINCFPFCLNLSLTQVLNTFLSLGFIWGLFPTRCPFVLWFIFSGEFVFPPLPCPPISKLGFYVWNASYVILAIYYTCLSKFQEDMLHMHLYLSLSFWCICREGWDLFFYLSNLSLPVSSGSIFSVQCNITQARGSSPSIPFLKVHVFQRVALGGSTFSHLAAHPEACGLWGTASSL